MNARIVVAIGVVLVMCAVMFALARQLRGISRGRLLVNLLFPLSQLCVVAFLFFCTITYALPTWVFALAAAIGLVCGPIDLALFRALRASEERELARERVRLLEEQLGAQEEHLRRLAADVEEARGIRAQVASELEAVEGLLDREEKERASRSLMKAVGMMDSAGKRYCRHQVVDALVSMKAAACEERGIRASFDLSLPDDLALSSVELCAVFSNMLDNAIDACAAVSEGERFVDLKAQVEAGYLAVRMENSCVPASSGEPRPARPQLAAGLPEHGWGLGILGKLAARHDGTLECGQDGSVFRTVAILKADSCEHAPVPGLG